MPQPQQLPFQRLPNGTDDQLNHPRMDEIVERHQEPLLLAATNPLELAHPDDDDDDDEPVTVIHADPPLLDHSSTSSPPFSNNNNNNNGNENTGKLLTSGTNDGVFVNLNAKPSPTARPSPDSPVITSPVSALPPPPTYDQVQRDNVPAYTPHMNISLPHLHNANSSSSNAGGSVTIGANNELLIDNIAVGSFNVFLFSAALAWFLPLIGFLLAVLVSGTHAALSGSRIGTGLWFISLSFTSSSSSNYSNGGDDGDLDGWNGVIRFVAAIMGMALVSQGLVEYMRVKRIEMAIRRAHSSSDDNLAAVV